MSELQKSHFTTRNLPLHERVNAWSESISTVFDISVDGSRPLREDFNASVTSYLLNNQLMVSRCDTVGQRFERSPLKVVRDNLDYYVIQTHLTGSQVMQRGKSAVRCESGDLMIIDLAERHDAITTDFSQLTIVVPRHMLAPRLLAPDSQEGRVLPADLPLTRLAVTHLKTLFGMLDMFSAQESLQVIEPTLMLLASALNGRTDALENGGALHSQLATAKLLIERSLHRPISPEKLSVALGLSRSTLYRLFEPLGGVRAYVQERRLRRSAADLFAPQHGRRRICDIAWAWGFASEAHFSRAFRQRFGVTPREARQGVGSQPGLRLPPGAGAVGDRQYEQWLAENLRS